MILRMYVFLLVAAISTGSISLQAETIAIVGGTIIDGNGGKPIKNGVIVIDGDRIIAVGDRKTAIPIDTREIEAEGKYIIPGLMDANVHLYLMPSLESLVRYEGRYEQVITQASQLALRNGFTTVFDTWGPREPLVKVRNDINVGIIQGSRIYLAGNIVGFNGPLSADFDKKGATNASPRLVKRINEIWEQGVGRRLLWMTPDQVGDEITSYAKKDVDFVKYGASGHSRGETEFIMFSEKAQRAIVSASHNTGLTVQAHTTSVESLRIAIEAGVDLIQHCEISGPVPIPASTIRMMAEKNVPCASLALTEKGIGTLLSFGREEETTLIRGENIKNMIKSSVTFLLSTDASTADQDTISGMPQLSGLTYQQIKELDLLTLLGEGHIVWFKAMNQYGMKPMDALMAATSNIAKAYKVDRDLGTLEKGKIADLVILDKSPLKSHENYRTIEMIIKGGKIVDRELLPTNPILMVNELDSKF